MFFSKQHKERLKRVEIYVVRVHIDIKKILENQQEIKEQLAKIMSKIDDLKQAVADSAAADSAGFQALADALTELAADVQGLNDQIQNPDVSEVTDEIKTQSQANTDKFNAVAQAIRDAIATPTPEPALPAEPPA